MGWVIAVVIISIIGILLLGLALIATVAAMVIAIIFAVRGSVQEIEADYARFMEGFTGGPIGLQLA